VIADPVGRSARAGEIVAAARLLLEREGPEALTMRRLGEELGIRAPSLYKHLASKKAVEVALIEEAFRDIGAALHAALQGRDDRVDATRTLLATYRRFSLAQPNLYRLATAGRLPRGDLTPGLEEWAGEPFLLVAGEPHLAQALWSFAHGMVILEIDGRYPENSELDQTWETGAAAFAGLVGARR
jgi:AcrR family transcriptional regulator